MATFRYSLVLVLACHHAKPVSMAPLPRDASAHYLAGKLALYKDDAATAAAELSAAAAAAPEQPTIAVELARALAKAKRDADARAVLASARLKWPDHPLVWLASGELLEKAAPAEAMRAYRRTIELERDNEHAYLGLARLQEPPAAEKTLRALIARVPASVDGHYRLAQRLAARGELAQSVGELHAVLERDPDHIDARMDLARSLRRNGKLAESIAETRSAFDRAGQPMDVAEELFWLLCEANDLQGAIDLLTLLDDERSDAEALATVARLEIGLGRLAQAEVLHKKLAAMDGGKQLAAIIAVQIAIAKQDLATASAKLATIDAATAHRLAIEVALARGDTKKAREAIAASNGLGEVERAIDGARILERERDAAGAIALLEPVARAHSDNASALNLVGYLLADARTRLDDAERYLRRARDLSPGDPAILDSWGWLLVARGRTKEAIAALEHAARFSPLEPEILLHLAAAYAADHASRKAAELLARASTLHPNADVQRKIEALRVKLGP
jgi:predicted Zn-dependent protease